jgi:FkbM family methyltransferase
MIINFPYDNNVSITLPDDHEFSDFFAKRTHSEPLFRNINTFLFHNNLIHKNIIDLGSWIGDNAILWSKNYKKEGLIYAIDPSKKNIEFILQLCAINNITNIQTICKVVSDNIDIVWTSDCINHCSFVYNRDNHKPKTELLSTTINQLYNDNIIEDIGYMHLDAEGMEYRIILGSTNIFTSEDNNPLITFEQHYALDDTKSLINLLIDMKYEIYLINESLANCRYDCRNFIAFPVHCKYENYTNTANQIKNNFGQNSIINIDKNNLYEILK